MPALDDRRDSGTREDGAFFAPTPVHPARAPRVLASIVVLAWAGLVSVGALEKQAAPSAGAVAPSSNAQVAVMPSQPARSIRPRRREAEGTPGLVQGRYVDAVIRLDVRPAGSHLFIHGDVFSLSVARVSVRLEDGRGHVAATEAVDVPGGSTAFWIGAVPRFDVHFFFPDEVRADGFVVEATALDARGRAIATLIQPVARTAESL